MRNPLLLDSKWHYANKTVQNWKHTCWQTSFFLCFLLYFCVIELFCSYCYTLHTIMFDFMLTTYCFSELPHTSFQAFSKSPSNDFLFVFHMNIFCSKELVFVPSSFKMIKKAPLVQCSCIWLKQCLSQNLWKRFKELKKRMNSFETFLWPCVWKSHIWKVPNFPCIRNILYKPKIYKSIVCKILKLFFCSAFHLCPNKNHNIVIRFYHNYFSRTTAATFLELGQSPTEKDIYLENTMPVK